MSAVLKQPETDTIKVYEPFRVELKLYREPVEFDYEDSEGNKAARSHIHKLRRIKGAVESARKEEKAASLAYGRLVDGQATEIKNEIDELIAVHYEPLKAIEDREKNRIESLQGRLAWFANMATAIDEDGEPLGSNRLLSMLAEVRSVPLDDSWQEFLAEAGQAKDEAVNALERHAAAARKREEEAAELQRLREVQAEADRLAEQKRIEEAAAKRARDEAEAKAKAEREAAQAEQHKKEEAHAQALRDAEKKLKDQQEAAERRELELKLDAERKERERREAEDAARAEKEARERDEAHRTDVHDEIAAYLVKRGVPAKQATTVVSELATGNVPHVSINY